MFILPERPLADIVQVASPQRTSNELVTRAHEPPDPAAELWLPKEAINRINGRRRGYLLVPRPAPTLHAQSPLLWPAFTCSPTIALLALSAQVTEPSRWKDELAWQVHITESSGEGGIVFFLLIVLMTTP